MEQTTQLIEKLENQWTKPFVRRTGDAWEASGGLVSAKSLANADWEGGGPSERFKVCGKIAYSSESFFSWLRERVE